MSSTVKPKDPTGFGSEPKASPAARGWSIALGLSSVLLGLIAARETWRVATDSQQSSWIQPLIDALATDALPTWATLAGAIAALLGLFMVIAAFSPRKRTHRQLLPSPTRTAGASMWLRAVDIARLSSATARRVPGVSSARTQVVGNKLALTVHGDVEDPHLGRHVTEAVEEELSILQRRPKIDVRVEEEPEVTAHA